MPGIQPIHFALGNADINIDSPELDVANALLNNQPFPARELSIAQGSIKVSASNDIKLDGGKGTVTFSGSANAYSKLGVYQSGANLVKALKAADLDDSIVAGLRIPNDANSNLVALQWGYNASAAVKGELALGAGAGLNFGMDASSQGLFAVIRQLPRTTGAYTAVGESIKSWKLPRQVHTLNDLEAGTWLIAETSAAIALSLGVNYGYQFSWVRDALTLGGLTGDIGLKVEARAMATLGFEASGRYALVLSREVAQPTVARFRLYKLKRKGWSFAFSASVSEKAHTTLLPDNLSDFIKGVFNIQGLQVIKDFETWTDPNSTISDLLGAELVGYAESLLKKVTGIDPKNAFDDARKQFLDLITKWHDLPHEITSAVYFILRDQVGELETLRAFLDKIAKNSNASAISEAVANELRKADFFSTAIGKWISAAVTHGILSALNSNAELKKLHDLATQTLAVLDGSKVEEMLKNLQQWIEKELGLDKVIAIANKTDFASIDKWLKARLSAFLSKQPPASVVFEELEKIKAAINAFRKKSDEFYSKGIEALTRKYTAEVIATYQKTTTDTALLDVEFDFAGNPTDPIVSGYLNDALDGSLNEFMAKPLPGVHLNQATLTHEVKRSTHIEINLPSYSHVVDHINDALAQVSAVDTDEGRLLMYDLDAKDIVSRRNRRHSQLAVALHFSEDPKIRKFTREESSFDYSLRLVERNMKQQFLRYQFKNLVKPYFRSEFDAPNQSFDTYVSDLDRAADAEHPGTDNLGNALISLSVSLPDTVLAAWKDAPAHEHDEGYMRLSLQIQSQLRQLIPFCYFQDPAKYKDLKSAVPLLVYSSLPLLNHCSYSNGQLHLNDGKGIVWDWRDETLRGAIINYDPTGANLSARLAGIRQVLSAIPELHDTLKFYQENEVKNMRKLAIEDSFVKTLLSNLLFVEAEVINGARDAGMAFAEFFGEPDPAKALTLLTKFGGELTDAFNNKIQSVYRGNSVQALGTMVFIEAARALNPELGNIQPTAMLDLVILSRQSHFVPELFLENQWPMAKDVFLAQRMINVGKAGA